MSCSAWVAMVLIWCYVNHFKFEMSADDMFECLKPCTKADLLDFYHALVRTTGMGNFGHRLKDVVEAAKPNKPKKRLLGYVRAMVESVTKWRKNEFRAASQWTWYNKHDPDNPDPAAGPRSSWPRLAPVWESEFIVVP